MSWVSAWLGNVPLAPEAPAPPAEPTPIPSPIVVGDPMFVDIVEEAIDRLTQQFKGD